MTTQAPRSRYANGSVANMVRSLVVIGGITLLVVFAVARVSSVSQPPVDVRGSALGVAREATFPIERPVGLPEGWTATSVRYVRSTDDLRTWHVGYRTPDGAYVAVEQTRGATGAWLAAETGRAPRVGTSTVGGRTWEKYDRESKTQRSLVHEPRQRTQGVTTVVTGTGTFPQLELLARHLEVVHAD